MPPKVVSIGEVLWDLLPSGPQLGGAPGNLAAHVGALGGSASLISCVGHDDFGQRARSRLAGRGVHLDALETDPSAPTGTVQVQLDAEGQPRFTIVEDVAWDRLTASPAALRVVAEADAICFGSLAQRTPTARAAIRSLLAAAHSPRLILCDINLRAPFYSQEVVESSLRAATALKLNEAELPILAAMFGVSGDRDRQAEQLARRFDLDTLILTLGAAGSQAWSDGVWSYEGGRTVEVQDTVGAGDSFTAAFVLGRLSGWPISKILQAATDIAAFVCTQSGATPDIPAELTAPFRSLR